MRPVTDRQLQVLQLLQQANADGNPLTFRELADRMQISSPNGVAAHIRTLCDKGLLSRAESKARSLRLTPAGQKLVADAKESST